MKDIFSDADVNAMPPAGGLLRVGRWNVHLPRVMGFCGGVLHALQMLQKTLECRNAHRIWLLGEIIHNDTVNEYFRSQGVRILPEAEINAIFELARPTDVIVIPAFGIPRDLDCQLREFCRNEALIVDTTCRYVKRIWDFVEKMAAERRTILVHGKPNHPETRATLSRALTIENAVVLIPDLDTARIVAAAIQSGSLTTLPECLTRNCAKLTSANMAIVNQTTMLYQETCEIEKLIMEAVNEVNGVLGKASTICRATQDRQDAALELCSHGCDVIIVVGGFSSSNTNQLYRLAAKRCPTYFIRNALALKADRIRHYRPESANEVITHEWLSEGIRNIGLLAGASCPPSDIGAVIRKLEEIARAGVSGKFGQKNGGSDEIRTRDLRRDRPAL